MIPVEPTESGTGEGSATYNRGAMPLLWNRAVMFLSAVGIFIAGVLSYSELADKEVPCGVSGGCSAVTASPASEIMGVKVAFLGLAAYVALLLLAAYRANQRGKKWSAASMVGLVFTGFGFGFSVWLQIVSITQIRELCLWCIGSAVTMFLLFLAHGLLVQNDAPTEEVKPSNTEFAFVAGFAILALGGIGVQAATLDRARSQGPQLSLGSVTAEEILPVESKMLGNADAKVTLVEFADMNCDMCRRTFSELKGYHDKYGGKLRVAYRHYPLFQIPGHETSVALAVVAEMAAEKGQYWEFLTKVMDAANKERVKADSGIVQLAAEVGLDPEAVRTEISNPSSAYVDKVNDDYNLARTGLKITGTPTYILVADGLPPTPVDHKAIATTLENGDYAPLLK